jgi:hypothetical protein
MVNIIDFPSPTPPDTLETLRSKEYEDLCNQWRGLEFEVQRLARLITAAKTPDKLTDDQKFWLQWETECLFNIVRSPDASGMRLPKDEYKRRREVYIRSLGLGHLF